MNKICKKLLSICLISIVAFATFSLGIGAAADTVTGSDVAAYAKRFVGCSYSSGGKGPNSFDCSGFVYYVYKHFGISMPASSSAYFSNPSKYGTVVSASEAKAGDIVSWNGHVAIYLGNNSIVHAATPAKGVCIMKDLRSLVKNGQKNPKHYFIRVVGSASTKKVETTTNDSPQIYKFQTNKKTYQTGDKVVFKLSGENCDSYKINIYKNSELIKTADTKNNSYSFTANESGDYSAVCTAASSSADKTTKSAKITWKVKKPEPTTTAQPTTQPTTQAVDDQEVTTTQAAVVEEKAETSTAKPSKKPCLEMLKAPQPLAEVIDDSIIQPIATNDSEQAALESKWLILAMMFGWIWY